ncbi:MAG: hypothetical protein E6I91_06285 [Chloroflexi bacterium]|nr:MAG: hypothetical protein E6I91_06285 [Chloroflexota bacterium]
MSGRLSTAFPVPDTWRMDIHSTGTRPGHGLASAMDEVHQTCPPIVPRYTFTAGCRQRVGLYHQWLNHPPVDSLWAHNWASNSPSGLEVLEKTGRRHPLKMTAQIP